MQSTENLKKDKQNEQLINVTDLHLRSAKSADILLLNILKDTIVISNWLTTIMTRTNIFQKKAEHQPDGLNRLELSSTYRKTLTGSHLKKNLICHDSQ